MWCQNNEEHKTYVADIVALRELSESIVRHSKALTILLNTSTRPSMSDEDFRNFVNVVSRAALFPEPALPTHADPVKTESKETNLEEDEPKEPASARYVLQEFLNKLDREITKKIAKESVYTTTFHIDSSTNWPFVLLNADYIPHSWPTTSNYRSVKLQIFPFQASLVNVTMNGEMSQSFVWNINDKTIEALGEQITNFLWPK